MLFLALLAVPPPSPKPPQGFVCGPGTTLQGGTCIVECAERRRLTEGPFEAPPIGSICGPGTELDDGTCMIDCDETRRLSVTQ